jgi:hypothetical protein
LPKFLVFLCSLRVERCLELVYCDHT